MSHNTTPLVSVGLPVFNGGSEVRRAIETLLAQTHMNLEIIISDNASTDETEAICREFAAQDVRVIYHRNLQNLGASPNFEKVLHLATGDYFMWAAHDDWWEPEFVEANLSNLLANPAVIASVSRVVFMDGDREFHLRPWVPPGTNSLLGSVQANIRRYVRDPGMNTRIYGLFRRKDLLRCLPLVNYCAGDWTFIVRTLAFGKFAEVPRPLFFRGVRGASSDPLRTLQNHETIVGSWFPMLSFTCDVLRMSHVRIDLGLCLSLAYINLVCAIVLLKARCLNLIAERVR